MINTYHLLFMISDVKRVFRVVTTKPLSFKIVKFASLILVNPSPEVFVKDRFDLQGAEIVHSLTIENWLDALLNAESEHEGGID